MTPIYPWITREGSNISKLQHTSHRFYVLGIFARRPKLQTNCNKIYIKINQSLIQSSIVANEVGIPLIAGCPLAKNFWELGNCEKSAWFNLDMLDGDQDYFFEIDDNFAGGKHGDICTTELAQILPTLLEKATLHDLNTFIDAHKSIRDCSYSEYGLHPLYQSGYKPIYLLMTNNSLIGP